MKPVAHHLLNETLEAMHINDIASATIRQIVAVAGRLEEYLGDKFVRLELGNPGLPPSSVGIAAERDALARGVPGVYPNIAGIPELKQAGSDFLHAFMDIDIPARCVIPTSGSMQATFTLFLMLGQRIEGRRTILFLDPGFPAQHNQVKLLGLEERSVDIFNCRGEALEARLEEALAPGDVSAIIYSNPNNPAWTNLTDVEFRTLARMAQKHDLVIMEDNAYLGMDFRRRYGVPFKAPFIPTIAKYTDRFILLVSASKIFSYAGQRIAMACLSPAVADRAYPFFEQFYGMPTFGDAFVYAALYCASSGTAHSSQFAFAAMLRAAVEGRLDFVADSQEYGRRSALARRLFLENGFHLVYDRDGEDPISDGFFFTVGYRGMSGAELQSELLRYGISTISLPSTGSLQQGVRVCVSMLSDECVFDRLKKRLEMFAADNRD